MSDSSEPQKLKTNIFNLSSPMLITAAPVLGYAIAYLNRFGEARAYGIPLDYISLSTSDALSRTALVATSLLIIKLAQIAEGALRAKSPEWMHSPISTALFFAEVTVILWVLTWDPIYLLIYFGLAIALTIADFADARRRKLKGPKVKNGKSKSVQRWWNTNELRAIFTIIFILCLAYVSGSGRAQSRENYLVLKGDERIVLLTVYGDRAVLGRLGTKGELSSERELVSATGNGTYTWENIGPLRWSNAPWF